MTQPRNAAETIRMEISDALELLDNVTAMTDSEADSLGQAELALTRATETIEPNLSLFAAAPDMLAILQSLLPHISSEVEQRKESGNDEYFADLERLEGLACDAIAKATGKAVQS